MDGKKCMSIMAGTGFPGSFSKTISPHVIRYIAHRERGSMAMNHQKISEADAKGAEHDGAKQAFGCQKVHFHNGRYRVPGLVL